MVKHTQTIRSLEPTNCLSVFDHYDGLTLKGLVFSSLKVSIKHFALTKLTFTCSKLTKEKSE